MNTRKILCQTDFSHNTDAALEYASTLAAESGATLYIVHVDEYRDSSAEEVLATDRIRRALFGTSRSAAGYGQQNYEPRHRLRVDDKLLSRAATALDKKLSIVLDGTLTTDVLRRRADSLARLHGGAPLYVHCHCPRETAPARIAARTATGVSDSESRVDLYELQAAAQAPVARDLASVAVDTTVPLSQ